MKRHRHHGKASPALHPHEHECDPDLSHRHSLPHLPERVFRPAEQRRLLLSFILTAIMMAVEVAGGLLSNSLALISDAGHMLTHVLALGLSLLAILFASRPPTQRRTFGFYRLEILAALSNGLVLIAITAWIVLQAWRRLASPEPVAGLQMMVIGILGLAVNVLTAWILSGAQERSLNIRSAALHMIADTFSSVGVVAGAVVITLAGWNVIDPILSVVLSAFILVWSLRLILDSVDILLEATPREINPAEVVRTMKQAAEVRDVHDLHIWTLTSGFYALSAHVIVSDMTLKETNGVLRHLNSLLCRDYRIGHTAIQFESESAVPAFREAEHPDPHPHGRAEGEQYGRTEGGQYD